MDELVCHYFRGYRKIHHEFWVLNSVGKKMICKDLVAPRDYDSKMGPRAKSGAARRRDMLKGFRFNQESFGGVSCELNGSF